MPQPQAVPTIGRAVLSEPRLLRQACLIGGEWVRGRAGVIPVVDPSSGETIAEVPDLGADEARAAIESAHDAFLTWRDTTAAERADLLRRLSALVDRHREDLARILTREQGKPLPEARAEIRISAAYILWFAEEARRVYGDVIPSPWSDRALLATREPVGVVAAITPWNFPSSMIARKLGPALAAGCTIVIKPAAQTPLSALAWGALCEEAGFPAGVVNIVTGSATAIGGALTASPLVRKLTFTGSTAIGKLLMEQSAHTVKKVSMELGGNAPFIVFDDADIDLAIEGAIASKYRNAGQTCVCTNRFLVQDGVLDLFARRLAEASADLKVGDGFDADVDQGPLIDARAVDKVQHLVDDAVRAGARLLAGGRRHRLGRTFFEPTVLTDVTPAMKISREEIFGPVASVFRFRDETQAIRMANDTEYGLACYFYTRDLARAFRVSKALDYGMVGVNAGVITTEVAPFGGVKESGIGREGSYHGIEDYLNSKFICMGGLA